MHTKVVNNEFVRRYFTENLENGMFGAGFLSLCSPPEWFSFSPQPFYSFSLVLSGSLTLTDISDHLYTLKTGDIFQLLPHQSCDISCSNEAKTTLYYVCFGNLTFQSLLTAELLNHAPIFSVPILPHLKSWMPALVQQLTDTPQEELSEACLSLLKFSIHLHRQERLNPAQKHTLIIESAKQLLLDACLSPKISFPAIADSLGISYETFRKLFKEKDRAVSVTICIRA